MKRKVFKTKLGFPPKTNLCRSCRYSFGSPRRGISCRISGERPDFFAYCPYFKLDPKRDEHAHSRDRESTENAAAVMKVWLFTGMAIFLTSPLFEVLGPLSVFLIMQIFITVIIVTLIHRDYIKRQNKGLPPVGFTYYKFVKWLDKKNNAEENDQIIEQTLIRLHGAKATQNILQTKISQKELENLINKKIYLDTQEKRFLFSLLNLFYVYKNAENYQSDGKIEIIGKKLRITPEEIEKLKKIYYSAEKRREKEEEQKRYKQNFKQYTQTTLGLHYYKILGIDAQATNDQIKKQFRQLAKQYHPDKYTDPAEAKAAEEKFKEILEAYEALKMLRRFS